MSWTLEPGSPRTVGTLGGTGANDVWIVDIGGVTFHTTGDGRWTPRDVVRGTRLTGIWAFAPDNVYVPGFINAVYHLDGTGTWDHQVTTSGSQFAAIWASGPDDLYAAGTGVYRSKGDRIWTAELNPLEEGPLVGVWGTAPGDIWTLDGMHNVHHRTPDGKWERQRTALGITPSIAIWGSGPNDIYALAAGAVAHSRGDGKWTIEAVPRVAANEGFDCIWGSGPNDVYIGSRFGNLYRSVGDGKWYRDSLPPMPPFLQSISSVWGPTSDDIYVLAGVGIYRGRPVN